ncbi:hypothetical protein ACU686_03450 [Yinghuangia aomiensis]
MLHADTRSELGKRHGARADAKESPHRELRVRPCCPAYLGANTAVALAAPTGGLPVAGTVISLIGVTVGDVLLQTLATAPRHVDRDRRRRRRDRRPPPDSDSCGSASPPPDSSPWLRRVPPPRPRPLNESSSR